MLSARSCAASALLRSHRRSSSLLAGLVGLLAAAGCADPGATAPPTPPPDVVEPEPAELVLLQPADGLLTRDSTVTLVGRVAHRDSGTVESGAQTTPLAADGSFVLAELPLVEGANLLTVRHRESGATAQLTVRRDRTPPTLTILEPTGGVFCPGEPAEVRVVVAADDPNGLARLTLGDEELLLDGPGPWSRTLTLVPGMRRIEAVAVDTLGNEARDGRSLLCGEFATPTAALPGALQLFLGPLALASVGSAVAGLIDGLDFGSFLVGAEPLYASEHFTVRLLAIELSPGTRLALVPQAGSLALQLGLDALRLRVGVEGKVAFEAVVGFETARLEGALVLAMAADGTLGGRLEGANLRTTGLTLGLGDGEDLLQALGGRREQAVAALENALTDLLADAVPQLAAGAFARLAAPLPLTVLDRPVLLGLHPEVFALQPYGIRIGLGVQLEVPGAAALHLSPGYFSTPSAPVEFAPTAGAMLAVSDDLLNLLLHEVWRAGLLDATLDQAYLDRGKVEVELVAGFLGSLLDDLQPPVDPETPVEFRLRPQLPPLLQLRDDPARPVALQLGELWLDVVAPGPPERVLLTVSLTLSTAAGAGVAKGDLQLQLGETELHGQAVGGEALEPARLRFDPAAEVLLQSLEPLLAELLAHLPLPSLAGLTIQSVELSAEGPTDHYFTTWVALTPP